MPEVTGEVMGWWQGRAGLRSNAFRIRVLQDWSAALHRSALRALLRLRLLQGQEGQCAQPGGRE